MNIVILDSGYKSYDFEKELFDKNGHSLEIFPTYHGLREDKIKFATKAHGILVRHTLIDPAFLSKMKNLRALVRYGVGYDNIDVEACTNAGVKVANVQGYANHAVSDHALALIFSCARGLWDTHRQITGKFASPPVDDIIELHDKTLGIIGLGRIGSELSRKAGRLFREVIACDPYKPQPWFNHLHVTRVNLKELLEVSDVISIHCNLTRETTHLLNTQTFGWIKNKPLIINTSRGEVIDEKALMHALQKGTIHSAGLDVYENEPVTEAQQRIINHPRTICTKHYTWYSDRSAIELQKRAALNLLNLLNGSAIEDALN